MEKKKTNTLSIFQRPIWVSLFALTAAISWGWAYPLIKMGMEEYQITADMTGSKMLFAGIRFFISGIIILTIARSSHREFGFKKKAIQENHDVQENGSFSFLKNSDIWFLLLYALLCGKHWRSFRLVRFPNYFVCSRTIVSKSKWQENLGFLNTLTWKVG